MLLNRNSIPSGSSGASETVDIKLVSYIFFVNHRRRICYYLGCNNTGETDKY